MKKKLALFSFLFSIDSNFLLQKNRKWKLKKFQYFNDAQCQGRHLDLTVQWKYLIFVINTALTDERFIVTNPDTQLREQNGFISHHSMQSSQVWIVTRIMTLDYESNR